MCRLRNKTHSVKPDADANGIVRSAARRLRFSITKLQITVSLLFTLMIAGDVAGFWPSGIMARLELIAYDYRIPMLFQDEPDPSLVIIDIDERSISELGQWPWPRRVVADLIEKLFSTHGIAVLGVDVVFSEPESNVLANEWQLIREIYPELPADIPVASGDERLAEVISNWPIVLGYYFSGLDPAYPLSVQSVGLLPPPLQVVSDPDWTSLDLPLIEAERFNGNLALLQSAANVIGAGAGLFDNPGVDVDGVFRRAPLIQKAPDGHLYASLPLAVLSELLGNPPIALEVADAGGLYQLEGVDVGGFRIPTDSRGMALVPWYGPERHFRYVSAVDVISGRLAADAIAGAIVMLGTSAPGLKDIRATPVGAVYPGVEINLTLLAGMLHQRFLAEPDYARAGSLVILLVLGAAGAFSLPWLNSLFIIVVSGTLLLLHVLLNLWIWQNGLLLAFAPPALLIALLTGWNLLCNYLRESRRGNMVRSRFGQYVPPELVTDIIKSDKEISLEGEERELTVLFSDVRGFTSFSEQLTPAQLTDVMNRLLTPLTYAIHTHRGTIDKYMGDAVMAFWGAPLTDDQHAQHALEGAFAMQAALQEINRKFADEGLTELKMGIGVHSGLMNVGNMGSAFRMAYTVLGDNVNLGSRVEGLTKNYGLDILVTEHTRSLVTGWQFRPIDKVRVKGRDQSVMLYAPLGKTDDITTDQQHLLEASTNALHVYWQGNFETALMHFKNMATVLPHDETARLYIERCEFYIANPPGPDWDGVWTHTSK